MNNVTKKNVKRMVSVLMYDGVDMCVIDDILERPAHYIRTLSICDGEFIDLPLFCFHNDTLLTVKEKRLCLDILSEYICLWNAFNLIDLNCTTSNSVDISFEDEFSEQELDFLLNFSYQ